jgi:uncharacterized protein (DUF1810 family)
MPNSRADAENSNERATHRDVKDVLGNMDDSKLVAIMALRPTIADLEEASMWLSGDADVFGAGRPVKGVAGEIVAILTADEEEDPSRPR